MEMSMIDQIKKYGLRGIAAEESETVITYLRSDKEAVIDTADSTVVNKCVKLCEKDPDNWRVEGITYAAGDSGEKEKRITSVVFKCKKKCVAFKGIRKLTEEQRAEMAERGRRMAFGRAVEDDEGEEEDIIDPEV